MVMPCGIMDHGPLSSLLGSVNAWLSDITNPLPALMLICCQSYPSEYISVSEGIFGIHKFCIENAFGNVCKILAILFRPQCFSTSPLVPFVCVSESSQHWFRWWLFAFQAPSHYLNQYWVVVHWNLRNKLQWIFNQNAKLFIHKNASENVICQNGGHFVQGEMS